MMLKKTIKKLMHSMIPLDYSLLLNKYGLEFNLTEMTEKAVYEYLKIDKDVYGKLSIDKKVMIYAVQMNKLDLLKELEQHYHQSDFSNHYLLKASLILQHDDIMKYLGLKNGIIRKEKDFTDFVQYWIKKQDVQFIKELFYKYHTPTNQEVFIREIVLSGNISMLNSIVEDGFKLPDDKGLLIYAVLSQQMEMLEYLLNQGLDVNNKALTIQEERLSITHPLIVANSNDEMLYRLLPLCNNERIEEVLSFTDYELKKEFINKIESYLNKKKMKENLEVQLIEKEEVINKRKI